jgi:hypothetical protein
VVEGESSTESAWFLHSITMISTKEENLTHSLEPVTSAYLFSAIVITHLSCKEKNSCKSTVIENSIVVRKLRLENFLYIFPQAAS